MTCRACLDDCAGPVEPGWRQLAGAKAEACSDLVPPAPGSATYGTEQGGGILEGLGAASVARQNVQVRGQLSRDQRLKRLSLGHEHEIGRLGIRCL